MTLRITICEGYGIPVLYIKYVEEHAIEVNPYPAFTKTNTKPSGAIK